MKLKNRWFIEVLVILVLIVCFAFFKDAYSGYFNSQAAIQQLNSSWDSLAPVVAYKYAYQGVAFLLGAFIVGITVFEIGSYTSEKETINEEASCCEDDGSNCTKCDCS